ncbi:type II secretion system minor pseudopilin GspI [Dongshaea marina]|uniref:type II secretion system minor pseudopilin GspI n=1 Tax=Dongshaea marina TaxID=2047966 RepID=UPI000D3E9A4C|nr:type II secretion system minor pseudopilin GspI [Dongshaea marina]
MMRRNQGMTLLEVMIALVVFAIAGLALMEMTSGDLNNMQRLEQKTVASWIAHNQLATIRLNKDWPDGGWQGEKVKMAGRDWYVQWEGKAAGSEDIQSKFRQVTVQVKPSEDSSQTLITMKSFISK